jgi:hypothetical protein
MNSILNCEIPEREFTFHPVKKECIKEIESVDLDLISEQKSFKYCDIDYVYNNSTEYIRGLIDQFPIVGNHKRVLVDVKLHYLEKDMYPCLPGWHMDCTLNPWHDSLPEVHHIYIDGIECLTKFLNESFTLKFKSNVPAYIKTSMNINAHKHWEIERNKIYRYDRFCLHSPSIAKESGMRLLVRVTETNIIIPNRRFFDKFSSGCYK